MYVIVTYLWLSRHFLHRLICTTNVGTSLSKKPLYFFQNAWIHVTSAGQYFDVPTVEWLSPFMKMMRYYSEPNASSSFTSSSLSPSSSTIDATFSPRAATANSHNDEAYSKSVHNRHPTFLRRIMDMVHHIPPVQPMIYTVFFGFVLWFLYKYMEALNSYNLTLRTDRNRFFDPLMVDPRTTFKPRVDASSASSWGTDGTVVSDHVVSLNADLSTRMFEAVHGHGLHSARKARDFVYSAYGMVCVVMIVGTFLSLWMYGRVMPPLPDLVGESVGSIVGRGAGNHKSIKPQTPDLPWAEQYKSIVTENRYILHFKVIFIRMVEYMILCVVLPRSEYICKVTGHCEVETMIFESGNPTLVGAKGKSMYSNLVHDTFQGGLIYITAFVTTFIILISQMIVLNRSHLALQSYSHTTGMPSKKLNVKKFGTNKNESHAFDFSGENGSDPSQQSYGQREKIFMFVEQIKKRVQNVLENELGALSTSRVLAVCACVQVTWTIIVIIVWGYYACMGKEWHSFVLLYLALFGSSVEIGYPDKRVLSKISDEIHIHMQKEERIS